MNCPTCSTKMFFSPYVHEEHIDGVTTVYTRGSALQCLNCGEVSLGQDDLSEYEVSAAEFVLREWWPAPKGAVKYARKSLGMSKSNLVRELEAPYLSIDSWEDGTEEIPKEFQEKLLTMVETRHLQLKLGYAV